MSKKNDPVLYSTIATLTTKNRSSSSVGQREKIVLIGEETTTEDKFEELVVRKPGPNKNSSSGSGDAVVVLYDGKNTKNVEDNDNEQYLDWNNNSSAGKASQLLARNPWTFLIIGFVGSVAVSVVGFIVGDFAVTADNTGWISRGTVIADQTTQILLLNRAERDGGGGLNNNEALWVDLLTNVQDGFEEETAGGDEEEEYNEEDEESAAPAADQRRQRQRGRQLIAPTTRTAIAGLTRTTTSRRQLQQLENTTTTTTTTIVSTTTEAATGFLACEATPYYLYSLDEPKFLSSAGAINLWPVWKSKQIDEVSLLDARAIEDICQAEQTTQQLLQDADLCGGCGNTCFPPVSLVLLARLYVMDYELKLSCAELATRWTTSNAQANVETELTQLVNGVRTGNVAALLQSDNTNTNNNTSSGIIPAFATIIAFLVDQEFGLNGNTLVRYSTSIFSTAWAGRDNDTNNSGTSSSSSTSQEIVDGLFDLRDRLDRSSASDSVVIGAYDTANEDFLDIVVDELVVRDMTLAVASAVVTTLAMLIHTRSPWLTIVGLIQIIISFPLAFFVYSVVLRLTFFPFLNFIGVFVTFALGADDVFVACDKWKNTRLEYPKASIEFVAAKAFPDAATSMFLTSVTTAIAFFSTAICPTTALKMFAIFLGLLIMFDYILCVLLVFPALCLYDRWNRAGFCCCLVAIGSGGANNKGNSSEGTDEAKDSFIRRILSVYYEFLHRFRYALVVVILGLSVLCAIVASKIALPTTSEVRLLSKSNELEQVFHWKFNLFAAELGRKEGSRVWAVWGLLPADNGSPNDPTKSSTLVLDDSFDPSPAQNQLHLLKFCDDLFEQSFYTEVEDNLCPMRRFDSWLAAQSVSNASSVSYSSSCGGASAVPVSPDSFDACMIGFAQDQSNTGIFYRNGKVKIIRTVYRHVGVAYDSPYDILDEAWNNITTLLDEQNSNAPEGVNKVFASSLDFWWYDTNGSILSSALGAISIALAAAFVVVLFSSRSFVITFVAIFTIGFILASVTAVLVATGWTLGFLESVCFAILVGMSCDFVLHFGHAYSHRPGSVSRHGRTKEALILMGPSILAAAVTTIAAALVMMFTKIIFFQRFAVILFYSLTMGLVGAVFVFLVLTDTFGPAEPTAFVDKFFGCGGKKPDVLQSREQANPVNKEVTKDVMASEPSDEVCA